MATKQKSGLYRAKIKIGNDLNGKPIYKYASGKTQKELEKAKQELVARYIDNTALANDQLFGEYAVKWYDVMCAPHLSVGSQATYRSALNLRILPTFGDRRLRAITTMDLQGFVNSLAGMSRSSITVHKLILNGIFTQAYKDRMIDRNPAEHLQSPDYTPPKEKRMFTPTECERIESVCVTHPNGTLLACLYYLGVRRGEAMGLQWGDIDWTHKVVHIQRDIDFKDKNKAGDLKSPAANRYVPIPLPLQKILEPQRAFPTTYIVSGQTPLNKHRFNAIWTDLMTACDMQGITAHYFRHNYISMCWANNVDALATSKIVGHSKPTITLNIYTHLSETYMVETAKKIDDMFSEKVAQKLHNGD